MSNARVSTCRSDGEAYGSPTVRKAAKLQMFPDKYFFGGNKGDQYQQVGDAVPPWPALQIAKIVDDLLS